MLNPARMPDGNTAALARHEAEESRREQFVDQAQQRRAALVSEFIADDGAKHDDRLKELLADLAGGDGEFLHALQRGDLARMRKLFLDHVDFYDGDEIVQDAADALENHVPCRCRGECCC